MIPGIDYSTGRPRPLVTRAAGKHFIVRYISPKRANGTPRSKDITKAEFDAARAAGLEVALVFESGGSRAKDGYAAGVADAHTFLSRVQEMGLAPHGVRRPGYFAVDFDARGATLKPVLDYLRGVASVMGFERTGVYGGIKVVRAALDARICAFAWQTLAWSYGVWDPRCHIRQTGSEHVDKCVVDTNFATVPDYGQWPGPKPVTKPAPKPVPKPAPKPVPVPKPVPAPKPKPAPKPAPKPKPAYPGKKAFTVGAHGPAISALKAALHPPTADARNPRWTKVDVALVKEYQKRHRPWLGLANSAVGPKTYAWILSGKK